MPLSNIYFIFPVHLLVTEILLSFLRVWFYFSLYISDIKEYWSLSLSHLAHLAKCAPCPSMLSIKYQDILLSRGWIIFYCVHIYHIQVCVINRILQYLTFGIRHLSFSTCIWDSSILFDDHFCLFKNVVACFYHNFLGVENSLIFFIQINLCIYSLKFYFGL